MQTIPKEIRKTSPFPMEREWFHFSSNSSSRRAYFSNNFSYWRKTFLLFFVLLINFSLVNHYRNCGRQKFSSRKNVAAASKTSPFPYFLQLRPSIRGDVKAIFAFGVWFWKRYERLKKTPRYVIGKTRVNYKPPKVFSRYVCREKWNVQIVLLFSISVFPSSCHSK